MLRVLALAALVLVIVALFAGPGFSLQLSQPENAPLDLAAALLERVKELRPQNPKLANHLLLVIQRWPAPAIFQDILERIGNGSADELALVQTIIHRERLQASAGNVLQALATRRGMAAGIGAALLGDQTQQSAILKGDDKEAQRALLAFARLMREPLPIAEVGRLYKQKDPRLNRALDRYLESEDTAQTRRLLLAQHAGEALILGASRDFDPDQPAELERWEQNLRADVLRADGPEEILAAANDRGGSLVRNIVVRIRRGRAVVTWQDDLSRENYREMSAAELHRLCALFDEVDFDELPRLVYQLPWGEGEFQTEFIRLNRNGGRRVSINAIYRHLDGKTPYHRLHQSFATLVDAGSFKTRYRLEESIKGMELLLADEKNNYVKAVCQERNEVRVFIGQQRGPLMSGHEGEWLTYDQQGLGKKADEPAACPILRGREELGNELYDNPGIEPAAWQLRSGDGLIRVGNRRDGDSVSPGLWRVRPGHEPVRLAEGPYFWPIVTSDGRWMVVTRLSSTHEARREIVRYDLQTEQAYDVEIPARAIPRAVAELTAHGQVLIHSQRGESDPPDQPEYYLLDPATGMAKTVEGEFRPLQQQRFRPLQPVAGSADLWAAIPDKERQRTSIGRYDPRSFTFTTLQELPEIVFDSMDMWVDEPAGRIYIVYNGHLLRLPLPRGER